MRLQTMRWKILLMITTNKDVSFCRQLDPENVEHYYKFPNQTRNPKEAVCEDGELFFGTEDT